MTAALTFNLPEESVEHQDAIDGWKWKSVVNRTLEEIRHELKYNNPSEETGKKWEQMRACIFSWLAEENLSVD